MRVADRAPRGIIAAPFDRRHWRALRGIITTFDRPFAAFRRYLLNRGRYPWNVTLRTPLGRVPLTLNDRHDLLTVCEIFCRRDYGSDAPRLVVDIGANVGIAALYFLTRRADAFVVCCEPDPANVALLQRNLEAYQGRYQLVEAAVVSTVASTAPFLPGGRYGRIDAEGPLEVPAVSIDRLLTDAAREYGPLDLVKIDTEGSEPALIDALPKDALPRAVRWEDDIGRVRLLSFD